MERLQGSLDAITPVAATGQTRRPQQARACETVGWPVSGKPEFEREPVGDAPIDVRANEDVTNVTLGFGDRIGAIEGILTDAAGRPAPEYFVLAFPLERASWTTTSRRAVPAVRPGTDGLFRIDGLLAGQCYLAVVTAVEPDDAMAPAFLEAILSGALRVYSQGRRDAPSESENRQTGTLTHGPEAGQRESGRVTFEPPRV